MFRLPSQVSRPLVQKYEQHHEYLLRGPLARRDFVRDVMCGVTPCHASDQVISI